MRKLTIILFVMARFGSVAQALEYSDEIDLYSLDEPGLDGIAHWQQAKDYSIGADMHGDVVVLDVRRRLLSVIGCDGSVLRSIQAPSGMEKVYGYSDEVIVGGGMSKCFFCDSYFGCLVEYDCPNLYADVVVANGKLVIYDYTIKLYYSYGLDGTSLGSSTEPPNEVASVSIDNENMSIVTAKGKTWKVERRGTFRVVSGRNELYVIGNSGIAIYDVPGAMVFEWHKPSDVVESLMDEEFSRIYYTEPVVGDDGSIYCVKYDGYLRRVVLATWRII